MTDSFLTILPLFPFLLPLPHWLMCFIELSGVCNLRGKHIEQEGKFCPTFLCVLFAEVEPPTQTLGFSFCLFIALVASSQFFSDFSVPSVPVCMFLITVLPEQITNQPHGLLQSIKWLLFFFSNLTAFYYGVTQHSPVHFACLADNKAFSPRWRDESVFTHFLCCSYCKLKKENIESKLGQRITINELFFE